MTRESLYSLDNGITRQLFAEGEFYSVPYFAGRALIDRGWARAAKEEEAPPAVVEPPSPAPPPAPPAEAEPEKETVLETASVPEIETGTTYKMKLTKGKRP